MRTRWLASPRRIAGRETRSEHNTSTADRIGDLLRPDGDRWRRRTAGARCERNVDVVALPAEVDDTHPHRGSLTPRGLVDNESGPGCRSQLSPAQPPGPTQKVERSTTDRSSGVNLRLDHHIARRAQRLGGRCPFSAVGPVARTRCRSTPFTGRPMSAAPPCRRPANRPPSRSRMPGRSASRPRCTLALPPVSRRLCRSDLVARRTGPRCRSRSSVCRQAGSVASQRRSR